LLEHRCQTIPRETLHLPGPDFVDRVWVGSDRSPNVLRNLQLLFNTGRLAKSGYVSILPVDQGIEHSAGASFAKNPLYFDSENIVKLALEGGCNAVASTFGVLGAVARKYAHKIPFLVKINHNELLTYPNKFDQILFEIGESENVAQANAHQLRLVKPAQPQALVAVDEVRDRRAADEQECGAGRDERPQPRVCRAVERDGDQMDLTVKDNGRAADWLARDAQRWLEGSASLLAK
jgi:hypothetical protein